ERGGAGGVGGPGAERRGRTSTLAPGACPEVARSSRGAASDVRCEAGPPPWSGYSRSPQPTSAGRAKAVGMQDSSTILLVDDEDSIQTLLTYPLAGDGSRVVEAR